MCGVCNKGPLRCQSMIEARKEPIQRFNQCSDFVRRARYGHWVERVRMTSADRPRDILKGAQPVRFRKDAQPLKVAKAARAAASRPAADLGDEGSQSLFEKLRRLRLDIAQRQGVAPYVVFHDKTLKEMAVVRPSTPAELLGITGVGERKRELYGDLFLSAIQGSESDVSA